LKTCALVLAALLPLTGAASADPWKDESGKGHWRGDYRDDYREGREAYPYRGDYHGHYAREYEEEFGRGDCKVERKWKRGGEYKEEIKCKGRRW
jgi:hypothetical protein